ncbi:MAG: hypothetical protein EXR71_04185 [Myxococcales bacterium]|nr:hypothetical protein [Myxococcales bacterium]
MAEIEVKSAAAEGGRILTLRVAMGGLADRTIDRDTALAWLAAGHSLIPCSGQGHQRARGPAIERVEVDGAAYLRTNTRADAVDDVHFPAGHW